MINACKCFSNKVLKTKEKIKKGVGLSVATKLHRR